MNDLPRCGLCRIAVEGSFIDHLNSDGHRIKLKLFFSFMIAGRRIRRRSDEEANKVLRVIRKLRGLKEYQI